MRIQTWSISLQIPLISAPFFNVVHSTYARGGRQLPRQISAGGIAEIGDVYRRMDEYADLIVQSYLAEGGSLHTPFAR